MRNVNQEIRGYGSMSTYGYFKHDEMLDYAIAHHGIKGQKWGIRRYQNEDGSLTEAGKKRYLTSYGMLKDKAYGIGGINVKSYTQYQLSEKHQKELAKKRADELNKGNKIANKSKFNMSKAADDLIKEFEEDARTYGIKDKAYSWEQAEEYLLKNYKDYWNMDSEDQGALMNSLSNKLKQKGYYMID